MYVYKYIYVYDQNASRDFIQVTHIPAVFNTVTSSGQFIPRCLIICTELARICSRTLREWVRSYTLTNLLYDTNIYVVLYLNKWSTERDHIERDKEEYKRLVKKWTKTITAQYMHVRIQIHTSSYTKHIYNERRGKGKQHTQHVAHYTHYIHIYIYLYIMKEGRQGNTIYNT